MVYTILQIAEKGDICVFIQLLYLNIVIGFLIEVVKITTDKEAAHN